MKKITYITGLGTSFLGKRFVLLPTCSEKVLDHRFGCTALQAGAGGRGLSAAQGLMGQSADVQGRLI